MRFQRQKAAQTAARLWRPQRVCLLAAALCLTGVPSQARADDARSSEGLQAVTLQLKWQHQFQFAGYYAAREKGFYRDRGLDVTIRPSTGSEDFSYYAQEIPGLFFFLGIRPKGVSVEEAAPHHSPYFFSDEGALSVGVRALSHLVVDYMTQGR